MTEAKPPSVDMRGPPLSPLQTLCPKTGTVHSMLEVREEVGGECSSLHFLFDIVDTVS